MNEDIFDFGVFDKMWNQGFDTGPAISLMRLGTLRHIVRTMMTQIPDYRENLQDNIRELVESNLSDQTVVELHLNLESRDGG